MDPILLQKTSTLNCKIGLDEHDIEEHDVEDLRDKERGNDEKEFIQEEEEEGSAKLNQRKSQQNR